MRLKRFTSDEIMALVVADMKRKEFKPVPAIESVMLKMLPVKRMPREWPAATGGDDTR